MKRTYTLGHGTLPSTDFITLVRDAGIEAVVDIRTMPRSRRNPQYESTAMREWLPAAGIAYDHCKALGGFRKARPDSPNTGLRHPAFRGYADYMMTDEFSGAIDELLPRLEQFPAALMCSESVWWRCHRHLVADYLVLVKQWEVRDLMHDGRADLHRPTPGAHLVESRVLYESEPEIFER